jgi:hypothetical protein
VNVELYEYVKYHHLTYNVTAKELPEPVLELPSSVPSSMGFNEIVLTGV